jgi:outer membrane immunogenic protein
VTDPKNVFLTTAALLVASTPIFAADLPVKASAPYTKAPAVQTVYDWSGFYIGGEAGGDLFQTQTTVVDGNASFPAGTILNRSNGSGSLAGGYAGYNYQIQNIVVGIDGEYAWTNAAGYTTTPSSTTAASTTSTARADWLASVSGRLGYAFNNVLVYGKAGYAWAGTSANGSTSDGAGVVTTLIADSGTREGILGGIGAEWGFARNWSLRFEYDYIAFNTFNYASTLTNVVTGKTALAARQADSDMQLFKAGASYRFNWSGDPPIAKY